MIFQPNYKKIKRCRVCGNKTLVPIGSLGKIAVSDFTDIPKKGIKMPLELVYCGQCTLLQLHHNFNRDLLYKDYWYKSGINPEIVKDLKEIAHYSKGKNAHLDIGSNDGTLLGFSKAKVKAASDPSNIKAANADIYYCGYFEDVPMGEFYELITAIACLYDLPDPNKFIKNVRLHLDPNGIFISQLMTLQPMIENNDVGNICHEHLEYYSYRSLVELFEQNGLEIYKVEKNSINGGSYRIFAKHYKIGSIQFNEKTYGVKELEAFMQRVWENKGDFMEFFRSKGRGTTVGYGASTKGNTILQYYGINGNDLFRLVDVNTNKIGKFTIATNCLVLDFIPEGTKYLWVFPYGFLGYFKKKEKGYRGKWITTIPEFTIL